MQMRIAHSKMREHTSRRFTRPRTSAQSPFALLRSPVRSDSRCEDRTHGRSRAPQITEECSQGRWHAVACRPSKAENGGEAIVQILAVSSSEEFASRVRSNSGEQAEGPTARTQNAREHDQLRARSIKKNPISARMSPSTNQENIQNAAENTITPCLELLKLQHFNLIVLNSSMNIR